LLLELAEIQLLPVAVATPQIRLNRCGQAEGE